MRERITIIGFLFWGCLVLALFLPVAGCNGGDGTDAVCGNSVAEGGEECDDGNDVAGDGCENDCTWTCETDGDCDNAFSCDGAETCSDEHMCESGTAPVDGTPCLTSGGDPGACRAGSCALLSCGNGEVELGEQCDDGNTDPGDGCENDCTWTCETDAECDNALICDGAETCGGDHTCEDGTPPEDGTSCVTADGETGACRSGSCALLSCGNSEVELGEQCDDGNDTDTDECLSDCTLPTCGDGFIREGVEDCDGDDPQTCDTSCGTSGWRACTDCTWPEECTPPEEACNGIDDDCDGLVDEEFDLDSDPVNCGSCGTTCSEACVGGACVPNQCTDGTMNGSETDVDCGGPDCPACSYGSDCTVNADCSSNLCIDGYCITCGYGSDCESGICESGTCVLGCNLIVNGSAELGNMSGWTILENGGSGWTVESWGPPPNERDAHNFVTSFEWDRKSQVVDLVDAGYSVAQLATYPEIYVCDWVRRRWDGISSTVDYYFVSTELRDAAGASIDTWNRGTQAAPLETSSDVWQIEEHTYSGYTTAPATVYFEDGGHDGEWWMGWYGSKFDGARVTVLGFPCPSCEDGYQNQDETGVDCGGVCAECP